MVEGGQVWQGVTRVARGDWVDLTGMAGMARGGRVWSRMVSNEQWLPG